MLKIFAGISALIYAIILFLSIRCGIFDYEVFWWGTSCGDYNLTFLGYLVLCFLTFGAIIGIMLSEIDLMKIILGIVYAISMVVLAIIILEIGTSGLNLSVFIITAFFYFGMSCGNQ